MISAKKRKEVTRRLATRAKRKYGELKRRKMRPPLDQIVLGLLWRHTSTRRATRALRDIQRRFVDWNEVRVSHAVEIAGAVSGAAWAGQSIGRIHAVLAGLFDLRNVMTLDFLGELTAAQAKAFLRTLPSVSRDLADEILLFSLDVPVLPLSECTARMCHRMGIIRNDRPTMDNRKALMDMWEPDVYPAVTMFFVDCARALCTLESPSCRSCPMTRDCKKESL